MPENNATKKDKKIKVITMIYSFLVIIILYFLTVGIMIYAFGINNKITGVTAKYIPYPAVVVNSSNFLTIRDLSDNHRAIRQFYEVQDFSELGFRVDFSTDDGEKRLKIKEKQVLNKMVEDRIVEIIAKKKGIMITDEVVDQEVKREIDKYGRSQQSAKEKLEKLYGWTLEDFEKNIVKPAIYKEKMKERFESENSQKEDTKLIIEKAREELIKSNDFAEVARKYSEGSTAEKGGAMGWFRKEFLTPNLAEAAFQLEVGKITDIIETEFGYHIVKVDERQIQNDEEIISISQIFVKKSDFIEWLEKEMQEVKIVVFISGYRWNKDALMVEFKNDDLTDFENSLLEDFQGDASSIF